MGQLRTSVTRATRRGHAKTLLILHFVGVLKQKQINSNGFYDK